MSYFDTENNDIDLILIKYTDNYLKELTYYGTSKIEQMTMLINFGQELNQMEKTIFEKYYNYYVKLVLDDISDPNIYYVHKIFYSTTNLIIKMIMLWSMQKSNNEELQYKSRYLIGSLENYIDKVIIPIESNLKNILILNKIFKLEYKTTYLKEFIDINKNKFMSKEKVYLLNKLLNLLDNLY